ncbi:uncharacterized protein SPSK_04466 [Sporothrix schenckii 1099-18]|uniref:Small ribosomal subunit protein mS41 n=1 Tax=Sporothrix schenckii 1099-18 TaxID=1397361 RepID=A0A0F2M057_SPOSC|nr:uncharacterized protein SPSK_04466 [Sporothrix schenckii 1099-18]KJR83098.1 hypothetical protein SPSK_04466 [Sporothrix schenckii 1099-18]
MNSLRRIRPAPLGRVVAAAPSRLAACAVDTTSASTGQPRLFAHPFSSAPSLFFAASPHAPLRASSHLEFASSSSSSFPSSSPSTTSKPASKHVPDPIPFVPDVASFLKIIGRNMKQHTSKFPTWEALFTLTSRQLRSLGVEPARDRRYLLRWLNLFREGRFGIGGDFQFVRNGVAELRVYELVDPENPINVKKMVANVPVPPEAPAAAEATEGGGEGEGEGEGPAAAEPVAVDPGYDLNARPVLVRGYKVVGARAIAGPYALPRPQQEGSAVKLTEGMWEHKRGRKIDGGERRQAEVRFKRRVAERRAAREALLHASGL